MISTRNPVSKSAIAKAPAFVIALCGLFSGLIVCHGCVKVPEGKLPVQPVRPQPPKIPAPDTGAKNKQPLVEKIEIKCETIEKRELGTNMHVTGHLRAQVDKESEINPRFEGRVIDVKVKLGDEVHSGDLLCLMDSHEISDLQAELIEAKSKLRIAEAHEEREKEIYRENLQRPKALNEARTRLEECKVRLQLAESEFKRVEGLRKEKIAAEKDYLAAKAHYAEVKLAEKEALTDFQREQSFYNNRALLRRDLQLAEAETLRALQHLNTLKQRLESAGLPDAAIDEIMEKSKFVSILPIKTRVSGTVTYVDTAIGEMVSPTRHIFTVTDLSKMDVVADLPEADLSGIKLGSRVDVRVLSYPEQVFKAKVGYISNSVNQETRTLAVRAVLDNKNRQFKMNMSADIYLDEPPREVLACPKSALRTLNGHRFVFVKDGKRFKERRVELGADNEEYYEVIHGLKEGDQVVTKGSLALKSELMQER